MRKARQPESFAIAATLPGTCGNGNGELARYPAPRQRPVRLALAGVLLVIEVALTEL
jgi:hypothetical protein